MAEMNLRELFDRIQNGDRGAFTCVYQELKQPIYTICYRITGSKETAEDITHDVFVKLFRSPPDTSVKNMRAWIFQIARNLSIDALRKQSRMAEQGEYITVTVAVSFPEDKSMEELLAFHDSLKNGSVGWVGIRTAPGTEQLLPLCGMNPFSGGVVRSEINDHYPSFDLTADSIAPEKLSAHFQALLKFSADQATAGTGIDERYTIHESYYTQALDYVAENGVYSYGCYVSASPAAILSLIESGAVSSVHIEDIWIAA